MPWKSRLSIKRKPNLLRKNWLLSQTSMVKYASTQTKQTLTFITSTVSTTKKPATLEVCLLAGWLVGCCCCCLAQTAGPKYLQLNRLPNNDHYMDSFFSFFLYESVVEKNNKLL